MTKRLDGHVIARQFLGSVARAVADPSLTGRSNRHMRALIACWCMTLLWGKTTDRPWPSQLVAYCGINESRLRQLLRQLDEMGHIDYQPGHRAIEGRGAIRPVLSIPDASTLVPPHFPPITVRKEACASAQAVVRTLVEAIVTRDHLDPNSHAGLWVAVLPVFTHIIATGETEIIDSLSDLGAVVDQVEPTAPDGLSKQDKQRTNERRKKQRATLRERIEEVLQTSSFDRSDDGAFWLATARTVGSGRGAKFALRINPEVVQASSEMLDGNRDTGPACARLFEPPPFDDAPDAATPATPPSPPFDDAPDAATPATPPSPSGDGDSGASQPTLGLFTLPVDSGYDPEAAAEARRDRAGTRPRLAAAPPPTSSRPDRQVQERVEDHWRRRDKDVLLSEVIPAWKGRGVRKRVQTALADGVSVDAAVAALTDVTPSVDKDLVAIVLSNLERVRRTALTENSPAADRDARAGGW